LPLQLQLFVRLAQLFLLDLQLLIVQTKLFFLRRQASGLFLRLQQ
jgi:hypothetical protein